MGELGLNKIFGALLAVALAVMGLREVTNIVFGGPEHGEHHYESANEWAEASFHGYRVELADTGHGGDTVEEVYDLGLLLASADATRGERSFKAKCATCHTVEQGGANGTGPNLYARIGAAKEGVAGFGSYSGALGNTDGDWSYANMDDWLKSPSKYARGTSMGFAGLSRDDERANVLAYLASYTPDAPAFPDPLPAETDEAALEGSMEEIAADVAETDTAVIDASLDSVTSTTEELVTETTETAVDVTTETADGVVETVQDAADEAAETVEEITEDVSEAPAPH